MVIIPVIINPAAGRRKTGRLEKIISSFHDGEHQFQIYFSKNSEHIAEICNDLVRRDCPKIVVAGGDGTIREAGKVIAGTKTSLGIIPSGSGNGFARHFKISMDYRKALLQVIHGKIFEIDGFMANGRRFFCTFGIGFDAEIAHFYSLSGKRGFSGYLKSFFKALSVFKAIECQIKTTKKEIRKSVFLLNAANISQFGNHFHIAGGASAIDGLFDLVIIRPFSPLLAPVLLWKSFYGSLHKSRFAEHQRLSSLTIELAGNQNKVHLDGEAEILNGKIEIVPAPEKLKIVV